MIKFDNLLFDIFWAEKNGVFEFAQSDEKYLYEKNKQKLGKEWKYFDYPISYKMNRLGYRMKELNEIDYDNYVAFFGCSHTMGVGLPLEFTFAYKISKRLNCDYVNASVTGCSPEFLLNNFITFFKNAPKKPKCFIIVWPDITRTFYWSNNCPIFCLVNNQDFRPTTHWNRSYKDFLASDSHILMRFKYIRMIIKELCFSAGIELFECTIAQMDEFFKFNSDVLLAENFHPMNLLSDKCLTDTSLIHLNWARDIQKFTKTNIYAHPGTHCNNSIVDLFFSTTGKRLYA